MRKTPVTLGMLSMIFGGLVAAYSRRSTWRSQSFRGSFMSSMGQLAAQRAAHGRDSPIRRVMFAKLGEAVKSLDAVHQRALGRQAALLAGAHRHRLRAVQAAALVAHRRDRLGRGWRWSFSSPS